MKKLIVVTSIFLFACCSQKTNKPIYIDFTGDKVLDNHGLSSDSTTCYFPEKLFTDTIACYITSSGQIVDPKYFEKKRQIQVFGGTLEELKDTFKIETDSSYFRGTSYMLYKMKEPVLSGQYLGKDIYRIIGLRSFHKPITVRIENDRGKTVIVFKELNRHITYPFFVFSDRILIFEPPEIKGIRYKVDEIQYERAKRENDSLRNLYNNTNYYLILNEHEEVVSSVWDSLEVLIDSARFWKTKPELYLNHTQLDGSMWFIEGHFKSGYQIRRIPSPHFSSSNYPHNYDKNDYYARIFRFLVENTKLEHEDLY